MATISNTPRPGYIWDATDNVWYPIGVGAHQHTNAADTPAVMPYSTYAAAGKNAVINGDFNVWQRGTTFTNPAGDSYTADRFMIDYGTATPTSNSVTRQTFTPGTAPVAGYEGTFYFRSTLTTVGTTSRLSIHHKIENVQTYAGQTVTLSFFAKADSARTLAGFVQQNFGSGGSTTVSTAITSQSVTTAWTRFSMQVAVPSISGKTIGTSSFLNIRLDQAVAAGSVLELWGLQLEAGSTVTAFQTATGNPASELAACQRYFYLLASGTGQLLANGIYTSATQFNALVQLPVTMRTTPTLSVTTGTNYYSTYNGGSDLLNSLTIFSAGTTVSGVFNSSEAAGTQYRPAYLETNNAAAFVAFSAEL